MTDVFIMKCILIFCFVIIPACMVIALIINKVFFKNKNYDDKYNGDDL